MITFSPEGGGEESVVLDSVHCEGGWAVRQKEIDFFRPTDEKGRSDRWGEFCGFVMSLNPDRVTWRVGLTAERKTAKTWHH